LNRLLIIVVAPSGAGKTSFLNRVVQDLVVLEDTITYTTRPMRAGEREGVPYHFISPDRFRGLLAQEFFVEWAEVHGNLYGTSAQQLEDIWNRGRIPIMDVDVQGARTFKQKYPAAKAIFILPPSIEELRHRVIKRDNNPKDLEIRMKNAEIEIRAAKDFDFQLINDVFETSYAKFKKMVEEVLKDR
jgi:guanylate kinase